MRPGSGTRPSTPWNRTGGNVVTSHSEDGTPSGRGHEYLAQIPDGVLVLGGGVSRQLDTAGVTMSPFGTCTWALTRMPEVSGRLDQTLGGQVVAVGDSPLVIRALS